jgi:hypothetical protein
MTNQYVEITFDCLPLRSLPRLDAPPDASEEEEAMALRVREAVARHGTHNAFFLYNARCIFHLTNHEQIGMLEFSFEGTVLTDPDDRHAVSTDLTAELLRETCDWITEPVVDWFKRTVGEAVRVEFDRYIEAGDLGRTVERMQRLSAESDARGGFLGMGL